MDHLAVAYVDAVMFVAAPLGDEVRTDCRFVVEADCGGVRYGGNGPLRRLPVDVCLLVDGVHGAPRGPIQKSNTVAQSFASTGPAFSTPCLQRRITENTGMTRGLV
jgi:hypothetical protein